MAYRSAAGKGMSVFGKIAAWMGFSAAAAMGKTAAPIKLKTESSTAEGNISHIYNMARILKSQSRTRNKGGKLNQRQARKLIRQGGNAAKLKARARG